MLIERATRSIRAALRFVDLLTRQFGQQGGARLAEDQRQVI